MILRPPRSTRTDPLFPSPPHFRAEGLPIDDIGRARMDKALAELEESAPGSPTCCRRRACGTRKGWPCAGPFRVKVADKRGRERCRVRPTEAADDGDGRFLALWRAHV